MWLAATYWTEPTVISVINEESSFGQGYHRSDRIIRSLEVQNFAINYVILAEQLLSHYVISSMVKWNNASAATLWSAGPPEMTFSLLSYHLSRTPRLNYVQQCLTRTTLRMTQ